MVKKEKVLLWKKIEQKHSEKKLETELREYCKKHCQIFDRVISGSIQNGSQLHAESCNLVNFTETQRNNNDE